MAWMVARQASLPWSPQLVKAATAMPASGATQKLQWFMVFEPSWEMAGPFDQGVLVTIHPWA